jgi:hypothetical protein
MKANQIETEEDMTKDRRGAGWDNGMECNIAEERSKGGC